MIGEKVHNYEITAHLGKGGMGTVYRATDTMLGREVALKMLHPQLTVEAQFLERFKKEARVLAQLLHPNIAVIYNFIEQGGNHYMVMEYVEGTNLDDLLKRYKTLPVDFVVPVFIQALEGLNHAHKKNVLHRDIKPANLMITPEGTVKLMDFGIAKITGEQRMTQVNKIIGTVEFMAPELIQGKDASTASDIYAMGLTLYEVLSGKLPFETDTDFNLMQAILKKKINPPDKLNAAIPKALSDIVMKAVDKNPDNRYTDARSFQQALIKAFPDFNEINTALLNSTAAVTQTAESGVPLTKMAAGLTGSAPGTRLETTTKQTSVAGDFRNGIKENKKFYLGLLIFLFLLISSLMIFDNKGKSGLQATTDSLTNSGHKIEGSNNPATGTIVPPDINKPDPVSGGTIPVTSPAPIVKTKETKEVKEVKEVKEIKTVPKEEPPPTQETKAQTKDVYITSKVEVELYLRENLENSPERTDIPVTFSAKNTVRYSGVAIINQGAIATGVIKMGKIQTDVEINYINAANGGKIRIKAERGHGKRKDIASDRNYTAIILPGTRINF